jgi:phage/plasmid-associated DNA primase
MPRLYNKEAFSYIKGAITGSDTVEINEKFKPKKKLSILPQIIACTNFEFELYDTSEGMTRRVCILPTEYEIPPELRDGNLQFKLVLNTLNLEEIADYRMKYSGNEADGELIIKMRTAEKGVLDSLRDGSLAWFANKCRYEYFKAAKANFLIGSSLGMTEKLEGTFSGGFDAELVEFLGWYITERGKSIWTKELYAEYIEWHTEASEGTLMSERAFSRNLAKAIRTCIDKGHKVEMRKALNDKRMSLNKLFVGDDVTGES